MDGLFMVNARFIIGYCRKTEKTLREFLVEEKADKWEMAKRSCGEKCSGEKSGRAIASLRRFPSGSSTFIGLASFSTDVFSSSIEK